MGREKCPTRTNGAEEEEDMVVVVGVVGREAESGEGQHSGNGALGWEAGEKRQEEEEEETTDGEATIGEADVGEPPASVSQGGVAVPFKRGGGEGGGGGGGRQTAVAWVFSSPTLFSSVPPRAASR